MDSNQVPCFRFLVADYCGPQGFFRLRSQVERLRADVERFAGFIYPSGARVVLDFSSVTTQPTARYYLRRWWTAPEFSLLGIKVESIDWQSRICSRESLF